MTINAFIGIHLTILLLILFAVINDLKWRRIPNRLTLSFALIGLGINLALDFPKGAITGMTGFIAGFSVFLIPYMMKVLGAGDVKLMAALGAITDWKTVLLIALFTALSGGIIVIMIRVVKGGLFRTIKRTRNLLLFYLFGLVYVVTSLPTMALRKETHRIDVSDKQQDYIPYGVAIAAGTVITLVLLRLNLIHGVSL